MTIFASLFRGVRRRTAPRLIAGLLLSVTGAVAAGTLEPVALRTENLAEPLGIDVTQPRLSWTLHACSAEARGLRTTACQILVASSPALVAESHADLWNSGTIVSDESVLVPYRGRALASREQCFWSVRVRDQAGEWSDWSAPACWTMGVVQKTDWTAKWIGTGDAFTGVPPDTDDAPPDNTVPDPWFRRTVELAQAPKRATAFVTSVGFHELYVNGRKVGDAVLAPSVTDNSTAARYVAYEIGDLLHAGKNVIGLWLGTGWSIYPAFATKDKPRAAIAAGQFDLDFADGHSQRIVTDRSWRTHASPNTLLGVWNFRNYGGELYDAGRDIPDWAGVGLDDTDWKTAVEYAPALALSADKVEPNRLMTELRPVGVTEPEPGVYRVDMGKNFAGWTEIGVRGAPGDQVEFLFSEDPEKPITHRLRNVLVIGPGGQSAFRNHFNYSVGRWITIRGLKQAPAAKDIRGWLVRNSYAGATSFECSNPLLNQIQATGRWTFENLSLGGYVVDCPQRERMGYGGDAHATTTGALSNYELGAFYTKWSEDWRNIQGRAASWGLGIKEGEAGSGQSEPGNLPYTAPTYWGGGGPGWSGFCVHLPWEVYRRYGDRRILEVNFPTIERWLAFLDTKAKQNILRRWGGEWDFLGDWLWPHMGEMQKDSRETLFFNNCYWLYNLATAAEIADTLGRREQAAIWRARADEVRRAVHAEFYQPADHSYVNGDQAYLALALLTKVPPDELRPAVWQRLEREIMEVRGGHIHAGITGGAFLFKLLMESHRDDLIYAMVNQRDHPSWGDMLRQGATTFWESWDEGGGSLLHSSYLYVNAWFVHGVLGIQPDPVVPGFKRFVIRPGPLDRPDLTSAKGHYDSIHGRIASAWTREPERFTLKVEIPPDTSARVYLPATEAAAITEGGRALPACAEIAFKGFEGDRAVLEVPSGTYAFAVALKSSGAAIPTVAPGNALAAAFAQPPAEARPMIWWHWVNGNVTRDGIERDLRAMKDAGIGGFHLFDVLKAAPGPVRYGSAEWVADRAFALRRARELGLKTGLHCAPGWSLAGGPWVTPEKSMKCVVWTETIVQGGATDVVLPEAPRVEGVYHDVAVLAVPCSATDLADLARPRPTVEMEGSSSNFSALVDGDVRTSCELPKPSEQAPVALRLTFPAPITVRALECALPAGLWVLPARTTLEASADGVRFELLRDFQMTGSNGIPPVVAVDLPETTARVFRLRLYQPTDFLAPTALAEIRLHASQRIENWGVLSGRMAQTPAVSRTPRSTAPGIAAESVVDVSAYMDASGRLRWNAPEGTWTVLRFAYTSTGEKNHPVQPEASGLEVDKMDADAVRAYLHESIGRELALPGALNMLLVDNWEVGAQNWTAGFAERFREIAGYDLKAWLPVLTGRVVGSADESTRFLWDFRQTISKLVAKNFYGTIHAETKARGIALYSEPYGGPFAMDEVGVHADVPMAEFWVTEKAFGNVRNIASLAHASGRPLVAAESFTAMKDEANYRLGPGDYKTVGDRAFASGLNDVFLSSFVHQPYEEARPGFSLGYFGSHFTRHESWWPLVGGWTDYLARCQLLLRLGRPVADLAYLRRDESPSEAALADYSPEAAPAGRSYDFVGAVDLLGATVADGWLTLASGMRYRALVLPDDRMLRLSVAEKLRALVHGGLLVLGPPPEHNPGWLDHAATDQRLATIREELWGDLDGQARTSRQVGAGAVAWGGTIEAVLQRAAFAPDFSTDGDSADLVFCHRSTTDREIYFVANVHDERAAKFVATFRATAAAVEMWDPMSGAIARAPDARTDGGRTAVPMTLAGRQSVFVVFPKNSEVTTAAVASAPSPASPLHTLALAGPWRISLAENGGVRELPEAAALRSLSASDDAAVSHFAGMATYRTRFKLAAVDWTPGRAAWLELGRVALVADVRVNGRRCGTAWVSPYRVAIGDALLAGDNEVEIAVATPWANRLIGDAASDRYRYNAKDELAEIPVWLTHDDRAQAPEARRSFSTFRYYRGTEPLVDAGLLGPVVLQIE